MDVGMDMYEGGGGGKPMTPSKPNYTLSPRVLLRIANLPWPKNIKSDAWLDIVVATSQFQLEASQILVDEFNNDFSTFFVAVCAFLKENNFLPEVEAGPDPDTFDSIDQMDERNW